MKRVILKPGRDYPLTRRHPWVFSGAVQSTTKGILEGDLVTVTSNDGTLLGCGYWGGGSIAVKMLDFESPEMTPQIWYRSIQRAYHLRSELNLTSNQDTSSYRLVHGEADQMPGLIVDIYGSLVVLQYHTLGIALQEAMIVAELKKLPGFDNRSMYRKCEGTLKLQSQIEIAPDRFKDGFVFGPEMSECSAVENGYSFQVDFLHGQKTGFFIDQRDNRQLLKSFVADKLILNAFSYSGGFTVYAIGGGAKEVISVDSSKRAIELLSQNVKRNFGDIAHQAIASDYLRFMREAQGTFDVIIVDPPAFAKNRRSVDSAKEGYVKVNRAAFEKVSPKGLVFTFSCSQLMSRDDFLLCLSEAGLQAGRVVTRVRELHQAACHPVALAQPEGDYLKGFLCFVE